MYSDKVRDKAIQALRKNGGNISKACIAVGIHRKTFHKWRKDNPEFDDLVLECTEAGVDEIEEKLFTMAKEGNTAAVIFFLKCRGRNRGWSESIGIELPERSGIKIEIVGAKAENEEPTDDE